MVFVHQFFPEKQAYVIENIDEYQGSSRIIQT